MILSPSQNWPLVNQLVYIKCYFIKTNLAFLKKILHTKSITFNFLIHGAVFYVLFFTRMNIFEIIVPWNLTL